jgi:ribosome-associated protein
MISITPRISLDESELSFRFIRSSGPGGQNVNKVSTAVQLEFNAQASPSLPPDVKDRFLRRAGNRISSEGVMQIRAQRFRTQEQNRADAVERLCAMVRAAAIAPRPRVATRATRASHEARLRKKRKRKFVKQMRGKTAAEPD